MSDSNEKIIDFFISCIEAENEEAFSIPLNKKRILDISGFKDQINLIIFSEVAFIDIKYNEQIEDFYTYYKKIRPLDKILLSVLNIPIRKKTETYLYPVYLVELNVEDLIVEGENGENRIEGLRLSIQEHDPRFNTTLLNENITIHEKILLLDEISDEPEWEKKICKFIEEVDKKYINEIVEKPILFIGGDIFSTPPSVSSELEWIKNAYLHKLDDTALSFVLDKASDKHDEYATEKYIEIFRLNNEQRNVVKHSLSHSLTVITGPPGTGKSQVVLNLLANIYINGKSVLFASKNNKAVNTVIERLESIQSNYCSFVRLGNRNEKKKGLQRIVLNLDLDTGYTKQSSYYDQIRFLISESNRLYGQLAHNDKCFEKYCEHIGELEKLNRRIEQRWGINYKNSDLIDNIDQIRNLCDQLLNESIDSISSLKTCKEKYVLLVKELIVLEDDIKSEKERLPSNIQLIIDKLDLNTIVSSCPDVLKDFKSEVEEQHRYFLVNLQSQEKLKNEWQTLSSELLTCFVQHADFT